MRTRTLTLAAAPALALSILGCGGPPDEADDLEVTVTVGAEAPAAVAEAPPEPQAPAGQDVRGLPPRARLEAADVHLRARGFSPIDAARAGQLAARFPAAIPVEVPPGECTLLLALTDSAPARVSLRTTQGEALAESAPSHNAWTTACGAAPGPHNAVLIMHDVAGCRPSPGHACTSNFYFVAYRGNADPQLEQLLGSP